MKGRIKEDDASVPAPDGPFDYYCALRNGRPASHPCPHAARRRRREHPAGRGGAVEGQTPTSTSARAEHSPDHALFAYAVDEQGSEVYRIHVKDLATGQVLPEPIESATGAFTFSPDSAWLFWIWRDDNGRPAKVYRRPARGGAADDALVYEEPDEGFFLSVGRTHSDAYIIDRRRRPRDVARCGSSPPAIPPPSRASSSRARRACAMRSRSWDGALLIHTNADGAVDFKVMQAPVDAPGAGALARMGRPPAGRYIVGVGVFRDWFVEPGARERPEPYPDHRASRRGRARHRLRRGGLCARALRAATSTTRRRCASSTSRRPRPGSGSTTTWPSRTRTLRKTQEIPSGHDPAAYVTRRL